MDTVRRPIKIPTSGIGKHIVIDSDHSDSPVVVSDIESDNNKPDNVVSMHTVSAMATATATDAVTDAVTDAAMDAAPDAATDAVTDAATPTSEITDEMANCMSNDTMTTNGQEPAKQNHTILTDGERAT